MPPVFSQLVDAQRFSFSFGDPLCFCTFIIAKSAPITSLENKIFFSYIYFVGVIIADLIYFAFLLFPIR